MEKELNQLQNYPLFHREKEQAIQLGISNNWRQEYYHNILMIDNSQIEELCKNYLEGFLWTSYYFKSCPSTNWYYRFEGGPSIRTLLENISLVKKLVLVKTKKSFLTTNCLWYYLPKVITYSRSHINYSKKI